MKEFIFKAIISAGYVGYSPVLPGTLGSLVGLAVYLIIFYVFNIPHKEYLVSIGGVILFAGTSLCLGKWAEKHYGIKDPPCFVIDELAGCFLALFMVDISVSPVVVIFFSFIVFRVLDITKPFPAGQVQKLSGGLGVVLDDLVAGFYTNIITQLFIRIYSFYSESI